MTIHDLTSSDYLLAFVRAVDRVADEGACSRVEAADRLIECADAEHCSVGDLANAVLDRRIRFDQ